MKAQFKGLAINSGKVVGQVCLYSVARYVMSPSRVIADEQEAEREIERFVNALSVCSDELDRIAEDVTETVGPVEAEIFITQKHILNDPAIVRAVKKGVREDRKNLERVITEVFGGYEDKFARLKNRYMRERSTDIGEVRSRLLNHLHDSSPGFICHGQQHCARGRNRIIVAEELTADMMANMNLENVLGIVTEHGGYSSHAAVIARSVGVPAVSGIHGIFEKIECGTTILVDGDKGRVMVEPDEATIKRLVPVDAVVAEEYCALSSPAGMQAMANASLVEDARLAASVHADGIGLFRTEIMFMRAGRLLSVEEQVERYEQIRDIMGERPVTFRLLDIGGDKQLPFMRQQREANPYLGWRGARFLLGNHEIFSTQVRAFARMSRQGAVNIMFPMVIDRLQLQELCNGVREIVTAEGGVSENVRLGLMFEVPSACMQAETLLKMVDFGSIGSNDLIQYLFAVDRGNELVAGDYDPDHPILWDVIQRLARTASLLEKPLSICGEMAGREGMPTRLLDAGITALSVSARLIPRVRNEMVAWARQGVAEA
jgi:phosphotransferase system enzyme I (PtsI)